MIMNKKNKVVLASLISFACILLYLFFLSKYLTDETAPIAKATPLYILAFTLLVTTPLSVKNVENRKKQIALSIVFLGLQLALGFYLSTVWFRPRSDYVLANPAWLSHLNVLTSLHYIGGVNVLFRVLLKRW